MPRGETQVTLSKAEKLQSFRPSSVYTRLDRLTKYWMHIRDKMAVAIFEDKDFHNISFPDKRHVGVITKKFFYLYQSGVWFVFDYEQILVLHDTVYSRSLAVFTTEFYKHAGMETMLPRELVEKLYDWGDSLLREKGNDAYSTLQSLEPMVTGMLLDKYEILMRCRAYLHNILIRDGRAEGRGEDLEELMRVLDSVKMNPIQFFEVSGLFRTFGHPTIDELSAMDAQYKQVNEDILIDPGRVRESLGGLLRSFVFKYIRKRGRWPACKIREGRACVPNSLPKL